MKHTILPNGNLKLTVNEVERKILQECLADSPITFDSDNVMHDFFEHFIANSEFEWIRPEECGDLTDAPILGIRSEGPKLGRTAYPVEKRWGWMQYAVKSLQRELLDKGEAVLTAP